MSRIGNKPILIPKNVNLNIVNNIITVIGKFGILFQNIYKCNKVIEFKIVKNLLYINNNNKNNKKYKSLHGLYRVLINNMIIGVSLGFKKELELVGVGYKVDYISNIRVLNMNLGFSHNIMIQVPNEINIEIKSEKGKNYFIIIKSCDKHLLGIFSSKIRSFRKPEPYKGKGVKYTTEIIKRKTGKSA
ncbi:50S ribosomal protein L6 [Blattabacterium cuenoti]|uniref:50S ribosomal protein L6 n=1 Tax=Blattabacterium cuenoti TaxID=1653831 RepID=UPI00163C1852|nr:50S ribosomal protein L6 [Blattabacterium cuenoti]